MLRSFSVLRSPFSVLRSPFSVLRSPFSVLRSPFSVLRPPSSVLRRALFVLLLLTVALTGRNAAAEAVVFFPKEEPALPPDPPRPPFQPPAGTTQLSDFAPKKATISILPKPT